MHKKKLLIAIPLIFLAAVLVKGFFTSSVSQKISETDQVADIPIHQVKFYEEMTVLEGVEKAGGLQKPKYSIRGGIVPHHLFAGIMIADFFKRLSFQKPKTIILIGPNHYERGNFKALSSLYNWQTPFGLVETDRELVRRLIDKNLIQVDENVLPDDHATSGILPFIKYYMRETKVVQILLKGSFSEKESEILATNLKDLVKENTVVIAAVDFSHYLTGPQAQEKDVVTLKVMENFDYQGLYKLNNDYLDSPASIGVLLKLMQKLNSTNIDLLFNTNSGQMQKNDSIETTSYFSIFYH